MLGIQVAQVQALLAQEEVIGDADAGQGAVQCRRPHQEDEEAVVDTREAHHDDHRDDAEQPDQYPPAHAAQTLPRQLTQADDRRVEDVDHAGQVGQRQETQGDHAERHATGQPHPGRGVAAAQGGGGEQADRLTQGSCAEDAHQVGPEGRTLVAAQARQVADVGPPGKARSNVDFHRDHEVDVRVFERWLQGWHGQQFVEAVAAGNEVHQRQHDQDQAGRDHRAQTADHVRPTHGHQRRQHDGQQGPSGHQPVVAVGLAVLHEGFQVVQRTPAHQPQHRQPTHGQDHHRKDIDQPAAIEAKHAAQESELLDAVLAARQAGGRGREHHADDVADDDEIIRKRNLLQASVNRAQDRSLLYAAAQHDLLQPLQSVKE